jgi:hypothetical protein
MIALMNDIFRRSMKSTAAIPGRVVLTASVIQDPNLQEIIESVRAFDNFSNDNDPHREHDFGKVTVDEKSYYWKIDYYALKENGEPDFNYGAEDPAQSYRVLTIMNTDEY